MVKKKVKKSAKQTKKSFPKIPLIIALAILLLGGTGFLLFNNLSSADYIVETNAFFAPFEYYEGSKIKGVDMEIIDRVAAKMGKTISVKDVEFDVIIDNVSAGTIADAGAAGLTITESRAEKVDFSIPYYTSQQYVIYDPANTPQIRDNHITWNALSGKTIASQTGGTGYLFADSEISEGVLADTDTVLKGFDNHQLAADAITSNLIDYAIADELVAKYIVDKNSNLACLPLYYEGETIADDFPAAESYAIAVNKNHPELLEAFNAVLTEMLEADVNGETEIDRLVLKYMGLAD